jgi:hypothetical protein
MSRSREQCIADAITKRVLSNQRKHTRTIVAEVYEEFYMLHQHPATDEQIAAAAKADTASWRQAVGYRLRVLEEAVGAEALEATAVAVAAKKVGN